MGRKRQYHDLYVYMNGIHVGNLKRESTGSLIFNYDDSWLNWKYTRPISLSMPLTEIPYKGQVVESYFDNLLPDSIQIRNRIQTRFGAPSHHCFDLLSFIGADCVGALQLFTQPQTVNTKKIEATSISKHKIAALLKNYQAAPLGMDPSLDFRISMAGTQEKTALLWHQKKWCLPKGVTPTSHIIKLPIGIIKHSGLDLFDSVENEWLCLKILAAFNLRVTEADIVLFDDVKTLVVKRFDRRWSENGKWLIRLPQEDMCQALGKPANLKYEFDDGLGISPIMNILLGSQEAANDRYQFMKTVFLFWVMGAIDGHAKNFSLYIESHGRYQLTPLYDVISAYPLAEKHQLQWQKLKMAMSVMSKRRHYKWNDILGRHWLSTAALCQFSSAVMQTIMAEVFDSMENVIQQVTASLPKNFPEQISEAIFSGMRKIKNRCNLKNN